MRRKNAGETGEIMKMVKAEGLTYEYTKIMETDHGTEGVSGGCVEKREHRN